MKQYKDLDLKTIREVCDLDFAHYTYKEGMCSCCYTPKDLAPIHWKGRVVSTKTSYSSSVEETDHETEYEYLLFKNADNGSGHVTKNDYIKNHTCIEWGFPFSKMEKVCSMLEEQLGEEYIVERPEDHMTCIIIKLKQS